MSLAPAIAAIPLRVTGGGSPGDLLWDRYRSQGGLVLTSCFVNTNIILYYQLTLCLVVVLSRMAMKSPDSHHLSPDEAAAYWDRVYTEGDCWVWDGAESNGYGVFYVARLRKQLRARRISYAIRYGSVPEGSYVRTTCGRDDCVRPEHLVAGSESGALGRSQGAPKRRKPRGKRGNFSKLTAADVRDIRARSDGGETYNSIAGRYGVSTNHVGNIVRRQARKDVK